VQIPIFPLQKIWFILNTIILILKINLKKDRQRNGESFRAKAARKETIVKGARKVAEEDWVFLILKY
jgi:hypothetical protein